MVNRGESDNIFSALTEALKTPLLQIARISEFRQTSDWSEVASISEKALHLVDAYSLAQNQAQITLPLEPLMASSVLLDVANDLASYAKQNNFNIEIDQLGKAQPVMCNRTNLRAILSLLAIAIIDAYDDKPEKTHNLVLGTHRSAHGTIVGAFADHIDISQNLLQQTRVLFGRAIQPAPALGLGGGAELAIADLLSEQLATPIKTYRHRHLSGIGSLFVPSYQLQLV